VDSIRGSLLSLLVSLTVLSVLMAAAASLLVIQQALAPLATVTKLLNRLPAPMTFHAAFLTQHRLKMRLGRSSALLTVLLNDSKTCSPPSNVFLQTFRMNCARH